MFRPLVFALLLVACRAPAASPASPDVLVYGATPGGIAAAVAAGSSGSTVVLATPYRWVGGLMTNGLTHADFRTFEGLTGSFLDFSQRTKSHYAETYGPTSPQARESLEGTQAEPGVHLAIFREILAAHPNITILRQHRLGEVTVESDAITAITLHPEAGDARHFAPGIVIDATYEGDLLAAAGAPFHVGREGRDAFGEPLAPDGPDAQVQGYNFRLTMTQDPGLRVAPIAPDGYDRTHYLPLIDLYASGKLESVFCYPSGGLYKAHLPPLPNGKHDINDVSRGLVRLSLPELSAAWPTGGPATRRRIYHQHVLHNIGMLYFLQNDPAVPSAIREEARQWGFCRDEYPDNGHLPEQLYVREGRRLQGLHVFTEHDTAHAENDARAVLHTDAIAMGDYGPNCHGTGHDGPLLGGKHTGEFYKPVPPYQIPYGTIVPNKLTNLLVPVAASSSHVGFCALRLEPIWMSLGQAAGHAAHLAASSGSPVQAVAPAAVQSRLHAEGAATLYLSDVPPSSPDFAAVQWWGTAGGFHGLEPMPAEPGQRGDNIVGQYYEAFPGHAAKLDAGLTPEIRTRWLALARSLGLPATDALAQAPSRRAFLAAAWELSRR
ncbi:FAD-dependent oxidoreductase [soil metagenome]